MHQKLLYVSLADAAIYESIEGLLHTFVKSRFVIFVNKQMACMV